MKFFSKFNPALHIPLIIGGIILALGLAFVFGFFVMLLWNWLMPELFALKQIDYWQAWGLVLLAHILFKSGAHGKHDHDDDKHWSWKNRFRKRIKTAVEAEKASTLKDEGKGQEDKGATPKSRKSKE
jgi:hypothetical protein